MSSFLNLLHSKRWSSKFRNRKSIRRIRLPMEQRNKPIVNLSLTWVTVCPDENSSNRSDDFLLLGTKYYLQMDYFWNFGPILFSIDLVRETETPTSENFLPKIVSVRTIIHDENTGTLFHHSAFNHVTFPTTGRSTTIWRCDKTDVPEKYVKPPLTWMVTCIFHGIAQTAYQLMDQTNISSQTDVSCLQISPDKCVQASIEIPSGLERLSDDFSHLLEEKIFPDVNLSCAGQVRSVHRSILAARSEVFSAMFRNKMLESETGSVHVKDLEDSVLDMLLKYVYSGKIPDLCDDTAVSLYEAGDKYAMSTLKTACSDWMIRNMTEDNCVIFLNVADAHSDDVFKNTVLAFMYEHPTIFKGDVWSAFSEENIKLAKEVLQGYVTLILK